jgi:hypothetical protein
LILEDFGIEIREVNKGEKIVEPAANAKNAEE